jgi:hypothetical protein
MCGPIRRAALILVGLQVTAISDRYSSTVNLLLHQSLPGQVTNDVPRPVRPVQGTQLCVTHTNLQLSNTVQLYVYTQLCVCVHKYTLCVHGCTHIQSWSRMPPRKVIISYFEYFEYCHAGCVPSCG